MQTMKINMFEIIEKLQINQMSERNIWNQQNFDRILSAGTLIVTFEKKL